MYPFIKQLSQPYTLVCLLLIAAVLRLWWNRIEGRGRLLVPTILCLLLFLVSWPPFAYLALGSLEWQHPPTIRRAPDAHAIVVLNAGTAYPDSVRREAELEPDTMLRCMHAAQVYSEGPRCPVIVTGGTEDGRGTGPTSAAVMRDAMVRMGVPAADIVLEEKSQTTYENAVEASAILHGLGISKAIVVTDATHLARSLRCFQKRGIIVVPSGCRYGATEFDFSAAKLLPNANAAIDVTRVAHEWLGTVWYRWRGRI